MHWLKSVFRSDPDSRELLQANTRNLIFTTLAIYLGWHFIATLAWPQAFSPNLWVTTLLMLAVSFLSLRLVSQHYLLGQIVWLAGVIAAIFQAYYLYQRPEITLLLVFLPLMASVTLRQMGTLLFVGAILAIILLLPGLNFMPPIPPGYRVGILLGSVFSTSFGWGLSSNLLSAINASTYHYKQARELLDETRQHRAEISRMLKDQHQANYQLERLNQMLDYARTRAEEARSDRDRFILAVSHELRSPLNFILGFSDLMVSSPDTYASLEDWPTGLYDDVKEIYRSSTHLLGLINDILDMGQIDAQQMALFRERARLEQIVDDVREMVSAAFAEKGLWLRIEIEPGLPEVFVDCTRLRQVLLNLINNSLRFTEQGGVTLSLRSQEGAILVKVEDTGSGIAPEDIPKVFDEFRQVGEESWRRREGTGLGLSISRRFVQLHGGKMWLESELAHGACFYFTVPVQDSNPELNFGQQAFAGTPSHQRLFAHQVRKEQLVLLLSADPSAARLVSQTLSDYQVALVERPDQLNDSLAQLYPRAILVDGEMMDQVRPVLKSLPYELPVLRITLPTSHERSYSLPAGVADYLVKPVTRQALLQAVSGLAPAAGSLLVVDDDPAMLRFVTQALRSPDPGDGSAQEYTFFTASTGEAALQQLHAHVMDVILLDLDLPDMSGWDILEQIKQDPGLARTPVVIVSAADLPQMLYVNGKEILDVWMNRPFSLQEFTTILNCLLENLQPG